MDINSIIDRLNNELDKLNSIKNSVNTSDFFTDNENFNDDLDLSSPKEESSTLTTYESASPLEKSESTNVGTRRC